jgi:hypothetical protein
MTLVYLGVVAAVAVAAAMVVIQSQQPPKPVVTKVRVVVASLDSLQQQCKAGNVAPVDILVDANPERNEPYHCSGRKLLPHKEAHNDEPTRVQLSYKNQDSVIWYSDSDTEMFGIASIAPHEDKDPRTAPKNPFANLAIPTKEESRSISSGPIVAAAVNHRYKISLKIGKRIIDPDLWCNP